MRAKDTDIAIPFGKWLIRTLTHVRSFRQLELRTDIASAYSYCLRPHRVRRKGQDMKIKYHFVNETVSIDVPDDWGEILIALDREQYNNDHKETRRHYSLESKVYEGMDYAVEDPGLEALFAEPTKSEHMRNAIQQLSPDQQAMVRTIYFEGVSVSDYASRIGVTQSAISHRLQTAKKKLKKFLC